MPNRRRQDPKLEALRERGTLNPKPEGVLDQIFRESEFFDARDLVQVKYEMIRRVDVEGAPVAQAAHAFGFSRPSFYEAQAAFSGGGLPALLPKKRGPRGAHKLGQEVLAFIEELRAGDSTVAAPNIVQLLKERFGLTVHRRSVERALVRGQRTDKRGSVASVLFPHTVLSYQNAAGGRYAPAAQGISRARNHAFCAASCHMERLAYACQYFLHCGPAGAGKGKISLLCSRITKPR